MGRGGRGAGTKQSEDIVLDTSLRTPPSAGTCVGVVRAGVGRVVRGTTTELVQRSAGRGRAKAPGRE